MSVIIATLLTYFFERPVSRALTAHKPGFVSQGGKSLVGAILVPILGVVMYMALQVVLGSIL